MHSRTTILKDKHYLISLSTLCCLLLALSIYLTSMLHYHKVPDKGAYDFSETLILSYLCSCTIQVWWWKMTGWRNWIAWHYNGGGRWDVMLDTRMTNQKQIYILKTVDQKEVNATMAVSRGQAQEFPMKSGLPGSPMGSGCAAVSIFVPQVGHNLCKNAIYSSPSLFNNYACQSYLWILWQIFYFFVNCLKKYSAFSGLFNLLWHIPEYPNTFSPHLRQNSEPTTALE